MTNSVYLEFREEGSAKFWAASLNGPELTTRWGKIDTVGQQKVEVFADEASANASFQKQSEAKVRKGYVQVAPPASNGPEQPTSTKVAKKSKADEVAKPAKPAAPVEVEVETVAAPASPAGKPTPKRSGSTRIFAVESASKSELVAWLKDESRTADELISATGRYTDSDRLIASHVRAPASLLAKLSHSSDRATRARVVANASTPAADYVRLGEQFPKEFLANPLLDLLLLEDPGLLEQLSERLLVQVLRRENCPDDLLVWGAGRDSEKAQLAVAMNGKAPAAAWERLRNSVYPKVLKSLPEAFGSVVDDPEQRFRDAVRERLAALTPEEAKDEWDKKYIGLAQFAYLSAAARAKLAEYSYEELELVQSSAKNPQTPTELLETLATDTNLSVRGSVAGNPRCPVALLEALAMDEKKDVRSQVAANPRTSVASLAQLATDTEESVRSGVARNPRTPVALLEVLAKDPEWWVRRGVAGNPEIPLALLQLLANDNYERVRFEVVKNPQTPAILATALLEALAKDKRGDVRAEVAGNPKTPVALLETLATDKNENVRAEVVKNPQTPATLAAGLLEVLAGDKDWRVRWEVAENPKTPIAVLEALAKDGDPNVRVWVFKNPGMPVTALLNAAATDARQWIPWEVRSAVAENPKTPIAALEALANDDNERVRKSVSGNPQTPVVLLETLANDTSEDVRCEVAKNPLTPVALLETLANGESKSVRMAVALNPSSPPELLKMLLTPIVHARQQFVNQLRHKPLQLPWFRKALDRASSEVKSAVEHGDLMFFSGKNPGKAVWSSKGIGAILALAGGGPYVEPSRIARVVGSSDWLVRAAVAKNKGTPPNLVKKLETDAHPLVRALVQGRSAQKTSADASVEAPLGYDLQPAMQELQTRLKGGSWLRLRKQIASNPRLTPELLAFLVRDKDGSVRSAVAENPKTPIAALEALAKDKSKDVRREVAENPNTPIPALEALAKDKSEHVRRGVVKNPQTPIAVLEALAKDKSEDVRCGIAQNLATPVTLLEVLATDTEEKVRSAVACNDQTPETLSLSLLEVLAKDKGGYRRGEVAENPKTPIAVLEILSSDKDNYVRGRVAENPKTPIAVLEALAKDKSDDVRCGVAKNPKTPIAVLEALAKDDYEYVRKYVSENPQTPAALLEILAKDKSVRILSGVAKNPNTPIEVLDTLAKDRNGNVRWEVFGNPGRPVTLIDVLGTDARQWFISWDVRSAVAANAQTPIAVLEVLSSDKDKNVRGSVARNPRTPVALLEVLATDTEEWVREAVIANPQTPQELRDRIVNAEALFFSNLARVLVASDGDPLDPPSDGAMIEHLRVLIGFTAETTNKALTSASRNKDWLMRLGVALHPDASDAQLQLLTTDAEKTVIDVARTKLAARRIIGR